MQGRRALRNPPLRGDAGDVPSTNWLTCKFYAKQGTAEFIREYARMD